MKLNGSVNTMRQFLEARMPHYMELLREMVAINSYTINPTGINRLGRMTADVFAELGFSAESIPSIYPEFGDHLILTRQGSGAKKIGFVSHLDTVFSEEDERVNNFHWREEGDRLYGPGTVDIKGGTIIILMMMEAIQRFAPEVFESVTWMVLLDSAEERDAPDFGKLCKERLQDALACLVFEGGQFKKGNEFLILAKRKGMATYKITVDGRASHAGTAHAKGANAILQLADVIREVESFTDYGRELTFNVGTISGGTVSNRVPHYAEAHVEMRAFDTDAYDDGVAKMLALNEYSTVHSPSDGYACNVQVEIQRTMAPWPKNDKTEHLFSLWAEAGAELGYKITWQQRGGLSDGNYTWATVPTLDALGPHGANAHCSVRSADGKKDQEYATRSSFVPKTMLNVIAVLKLIA